MNNKVSQRFPCAHRGTLTLWGNATDNGVYFTLKNSKRVKDSEPALYEDRKTLSLEDLQNLQAVLRDAITWGTSRGAGQEVVEAASAAAASKPLHDDELPNGDINF